MKTIGVASEVFARSICAASCSAMVGSAVAMVIVFSSSSLATTGEESRGGDALASADTRAGSLVARHKRGELILEPRHRLAVQEGCPAHPCHTQRRQLTERRHLRQTDDVHR